MPIRPLHNDNDIHNHVENWLKGVIASFQEALQLACIEAVNKAKETDTYKDQTGNLRASIGYVLYYDGKLLMTSFAQGSDEDGKKKGLDFAKDLAQKYSKGFFAVIVAGENYAAAVESRGYDVISGNTLRFENDLKKYLDSITEVYGINFTQVK